MRSLHLAGGSSPYEAIVKGAETAGTDKPGLAAEEQLDHQHAIGPAVDVHICGADGRTLVEFVRWSQLGGVLNFYHRQAA